jgi:glutamate/aspartate transport system substrate-binding protein
MRKLLACLLVALAASPSMSFAQDTPTIDKILERGEIVIGHRPASPPLGFLNSENKATGYSVEICKVIAEGVKAALGKPELRTWYISVDAANRIPLMQNGTVDLECAGTGHTLEREEVVSFLYNINYSETRVLTRQGSGITSVKDLGGKRVAVPQGTTQQAMLEKLAADVGITISPVMAKDAAEAFLLLDTGRADAAIHEPILLAPFVTASSDPKSFVYLEDWTSGAEPSSIMIAKGDEKFREMANAVLKDMMQNGTFEKIYNDWFMVDPYNLPMSKALRDQLANPNDKAIGE